LKFATYDSKQTLKVFFVLGFEQILDNEFIHYLYNRESNEEIIVDKNANVSFEVIKKQLGYIDVNEWVFDALYENVK